MPRTPWTRPFARPSRGRAARRRPALYLEALEDRTTPSVSLVSVNVNDGTDGDRSSFLTTDQGASPSRPRFSADGRYLAFTSLAGNLVPSVAGISHNENVYVRDLVQGSTTLVSVDLTGNDGGTGTSTNPVISADGRYVAFESNAADLVTGMTSGGLGDSTVNVFLRDLTDGTTTLISHSTTGTGGGNGPSSNPSISADGHRVAFQSRATDIITIDGAALPTALEVYVRDLSQSAIYLASGSTSGGFGAGDSGNPVLSGNGQVVAFTSRAEDLVGNDANLQQDIFARDLDAGVTYLVSATPTSGPGGPHAGNGKSSAPAVSADGQFVAFVSEATNLDFSAHTAADVYRRDLSEGITDLVSLNRLRTGGGNAASAEPVLSADGQVVAFSSAAFDLVPGDLNPSAFDPGLDVFVRDLRQHPELPKPTVELVSVNGTGSGTADRSSLRPDLSADGQFVTFESQAVDLRPGTVDTDGFIDVFRRDRQAGTTAKLSRSLAGEAANGESHHAIQSADGRVVAFDSSASNMVANDLSGGFGRDVFFETFTIDPPPPPPTQKLQFAKAAYSVHEDGIHVLIEVSRTGGSDGTVSATVATGGGTAGPSDYTPVSKTVTLGPGQLNGFLSVRITDDHVYDPNETVGLTLSNPVGATLGAQKTATLTIVDNDPRPQPGQIRFHVPGYRVREGTGQVPVTINRVGGSDGAVTVHVATVAGTARTGADFTRVSQTVHFAAGQTSAHITVFINKDTADEPAETFHLVLSRPTGGATLASPKRALVTIVDDDPPLVRVAQVRINNVPLAARPGDPLGVFARVNEVSITFTGLVTGLRRSTDALKKVLTNVVQFVRRGVALAIDYNPVITTIPTGMRLTLRLLDVLGVGGILGEGAYKLVIKTAALRDSLDRLIDPDGNGRPGGTVVRGFRQLAGDLNRNGKIDAGEVAKFDEAVGTRRGQHGYLAEFDFDNDGRIGPLDVAIAKTGYDLKQNVKT